MRMTCLYCASKHVAQSIVLCIEARTGYPYHLWLAIGHLAEAEAELVATFPKLANEVREVRLMLMGKDDKGRKVTPKTMMRLLEKVQSFMLSNLGMKEEEFVDGAFTEEEEE